MDIDIDCQDRTKVLELIRHIPAMIDKDGVRTKHNSGVYVTDIPYDPIRRFANIDYKTAEDRGYMKIDFLNMGVYQLIETEEELDLLISMDPPWERLLERGFCEKMVHIGNHYDTVQTMKPDSIEKLAMLLAIIRPSKRHLIGKPWDEVAKTVWDKSEDGAYAFKMSHSFSYAHLVVVHMNLLSLMDD